MNTTSLQALITNHELLAAQHAKAAANAKRGSKLEAAHLDAANLHAHTKGRLINWSEAESEHDKQMFERLYNEYKEAADKASAKLGVRS